MKLQIFVLKHFNIEIDNIKLCLNVDKALDELRDWLENDNDLTNYSLVKYELDDESQDFEATQEYDLDELITVSGDEESDGDGVSVIDSDHEENV